MLCQPVIKLRDQNWAYYAEAIDVYYERIARMKNFDGILLKFVYYDCQAMFHFDLCMT